MRSEAPVIQTQILRVLSTIRTYDVRALLMGGQACVLYGAAEYSRDLDLAVLTTPEALNHDVMDVSVADEQAQVMVEDRAYWAPLRRELEALRFEARRTCE